MLPSRGYFHDIQCPDAVCGRPYCHFGHRIRRKPTLETVEEPVKDTLILGIPTYKPTPKSELEQRASHIPISYVPDLAFRPERTSRPAPIFKNKPVYKPTPINLLSSINTSLSGHDEEQKEQIIDLQQDIAKNEYDPLKSEYSLVTNEYDPAKTEINFEDLTSEFDQIDDILSEDVNTEDNKLSENLNKLNDDIRKEQDRLNLLLQSDTISEEVKNNVEECNSTANKVKGKIELINAKERKDTEKITEKKISTRKNKSDEKTSSDKHKDKKDKVSDSPKKLDKSNKSSKEKSNTDKEKTEKSSSSKDRSSSKESKEKKEHQAEKERCSSKEKSSKEKTEKHKPSGDKEREKHRKEQKKDSKSKEPKKERSDKSKNTNLEIRFRNDSVSSETTSESEKNSKEHQAEKDRCSSKEKSEKYKPSGDKEREKHSKGQKKDSMSKEAKKERRDESKNTSFENRSRNESVSSETTSESEKNIKEHPAERERCSSKKNSSKENMGKHKSSEKHHKEQKKDSNSTKSKESKQDRSEKSKSISLEKCFRKDSVSSETASESEKNKDKKKEKVRETSNSASSRSKHKEKKRSRSRSGSKSRREQKSEKSMKLDKDIQSKKRRKSRDSVSETDVESSAKHKKSSSSSKKEKRKSDEDRKKHSTSKRGFKEKSRREKHRKLAQSSDSDNAHDNDLPLETNIVFSDVDLDLEDEDETMRECYRIFNEYAPMEEAPESNTEEHVADNIGQYADSFSIQKPPFKTKDGIMYARITDLLPLNTTSCPLVVQVALYNSELPSSIRAARPRFFQIYYLSGHLVWVNEYEGKGQMSLSRKRVAHPNAESGKPYSAPRPKECKTVAPTPGQIMANRYRIAKVAQANNEQESIMNEVRQITAVKTAPSLLEAARMHKLKRLERERLKMAKEKPSNNVVEDILNGASKKLTVTGVKIISSKKINAVPNVALIEKAKERIAQVRKHREEPVKTIAQTQKAGRVAHIPQVSLPDIPDVLQADRSKLPVNVRTRFLTLMADECFRLYSSKPDAYDRALNEEFACYEKCKVLTTYRNSAMLAVNRLRKEIQERQSKNLGPLLAGENTQADKGSDFKGKRFYDNVKKWLLTEEELELHGYPRESAERGKVIIFNAKKEEEDFSLVDENQRRCCRCSRIYQVDDDGWPLFEDDCMYHPLKKRTIRGQQVFLCCKSTDDTGCVTSDSHVSEASHNGSLEGYQTIMPSERDNDPRSTAVYALDCEMCYTTKGLELTRVTIIDTDCKTVYESLVKPLNPIIDYNTRFSGITKDQMDKTSTNILQVQANILHLCNADTILVGHSLESDMKALKIVHSSVIDTAVLFPHKMGLPHKRALRSLASEYLRKIIQNDVGGHDSAEDAVTCMELIKLKLKEELKLPSK